MLAIEVERLSKSYQNGVFVNKEITFNVARGEAFCLFGANGAGKSTLIRQIATTLNPTHGQIRILGMDALKTPIFARRVMGILSQELSLYDHLTVQQHIATAAELKNLPEKTHLKKTQRLLRLFNLDCKIQSRISALSAGQKKLVALTIALLGEPEVLLLDEPSSALDPDMRKKVWNLLLERKKQGKTLLFSTHYFEEAMFLADRVGLLIGGGMRQICAIKDLAQEKRHNFSIKIENDKGFSLEGVENLADVFGQLAATGQNEMAKCCTSLACAFYNYDSIGQDTM